MCGRGRLAQGLGRPLIEEPTNSGNVSICTFSFVSIRIGLAKSSGKASQSWSVEVSLTSLLVFIFGGSFSIFIGEIGYNCDGKSISFTAPA